MLGCRLFLLGLQWPHREEIDGIDVQCSLYCSDGPDPAVSAYGRDVGRGVWVPIHYGYCNTPQRLGLARSRTILPAIGGLRWWHVNVSRSVAADEHPRIDALGAL